MKKTPAKIGIFAVLFLAGSAVLESCTSTSAKDTLQEDLSCEKIDYDRGPLIIKSGSVVTLQAGEEYVYSSILIHKGGVLQFVGDTIHKFTILKSRKDFILEGTIRTQGFRLERGLLKKDSKQFFYKQVVDGNTLEHTYGPEQNGGKGGAGGRLNECHPKSCFKLKCVAGRPGSAGRGGDGGNGMSAEQINACKANENGKHCYLVVEYTSDSSTMERCNACKFDYEPIDELSPGKAGTGGKTGKFGGLLYLSSCENFVGQNGLVDVSGMRGGAGTPGASNRLTGGGGGGGGPGGSGGMVYFNVVGHLSLPNINIDGGPGGPGGTGGKPHPDDGWSQYIGTKGEPGNTGSSGAIVIINGVRQSVVTR